MLDVYFWQDAAGVFVIELRNAARSLASQKGRLAMSTKLPVWFATAATIAMAATSAGGAPIASGGAALDKAASSQVSDVYYRGWGGGAVIGGLALGLIGGAMIASAYRYPYYGYGYGYGYPGYGYAAVGYPYGYGYGYPAYRPYYAYGYRPAFYGYGYRRAYWRGAYWRGGHRHWRRW